MESAICHLQQDEKDKFIINFSEHGADIHAKDDEALNKSALNGHVVKYLESIENEKIQNTNN